MCSNCKMLAKKTHQNHSLPKLGTEKTPQCMKIPNLAWSYHSGSGLESMDSQFGSYLALQVPMNSTDKSRETRGKTPISARTNFVWLDYHMINHKHNGNESHDEAKVSVISGKSRKCPQCKHTSSSWDSFDLFPLTHRRGSTNQISENAAVRATPRSDLALQLQRMRNLFIFQEEGIVLVVLAALSTCLGSLTVTVISPRGTLTGYYYYTF